MGACTPEATLDAPAAQSVNHVAAPVAPVAVADLEVPHFERVRDLFEGYCGLCHRPDSEDALDIALALYDLSDKNPLFRLSDAQLVEGFRRFEEQNIPPADMARVARFIVSEFAFRDLNPAHYPAAHRRVPATDAVITNPLGCDASDCLVAYESKYEAFRDAPPVSKR